MVSKSIIAFYHLNLYIIFFQNTHRHTHIQKHIYMWVYMCSCVCECVFVCLFWQHVFVETYLIKQYRHLLSTNFCLDPFKLPRGWYKIWLEFTYKYSIKSTRILHTLKLSNGIFASLDVENFFTNVPVKETIDIIINNIYNEPSFPPLKINLNILRKIFLTCTSEALFYDPLGNIYLQKDCVSTDRFWARFSVISISPIIEYSVALKNLNIPKICWRCIYSH